ncbi:MAG: site-specific DNA-methyltransferase [Patescibacteria group bacterium]|nr:site-specific DNA-methyltransferase [Patescibacteria group bacterium]
MLETNKIIQGDCLEVLKTFPDNSVDLIITDPDYEMSVAHGSGAFGVKKKISFKQIEGICNGFDFSVLDDFCRVLKKTNIYIFCSLKQIPFLLDYFVSQRKCYFNIISWHKANPVPTCNNKYLPDTEFCLFFREKRVPLFGTVSSKSSYYLSPSNQKDKRLYRHPTVKPLPLTERFIINSSKEDGIILDPFIGSGTTAVAAIKHNRNYIGIELNPDYVKIANNRILEQKQQLKLF